MAFKPGKPLKLSSHTQTSKTRDHRVVLLVQKCYEHIFSFTLPSKDVYRTDNGLKKAFFASSRQNKTTERSHGDRFRSKLDIFRLLSTGHTRNDYESADFLHIISHVILHLGFKMPTNPWNHQNDSHSSRVETKCRTRKMITSQTRVINLWRLMQLCHTFMCYVCIFVCHLLFQSFQKSKISNGSCMQNTWN